MWVGDSHRGPPWGGSMSVWACVGACASVCVYVGAHACLAGELLTGTSEDGIFSPLHNCPQELQTGFL